MATLLMVESWLHSTGLCLPPIIRRLGHEYVLLTRDPALYPPTADGRPHPVVAEADEIVVADTNSPEAVVEAASALASRRPVDGVLSTCDYYLDTVAAVAAALGLPGARPEVMRRANQKHLVRAALDDAGLPNPRFAVVADWKHARAAAQRIGTPLVAKPVDLNAGTAVEIIRDEAALKDAFWAVAGLERNTRGQPLRRLLLLEERLRGQEVSVEAVTYGGTTTVIGITDKSVTAPPACVESGHMFPARLDPGVAREVEDFVRDVLAAIGYTHGLSHTEVMITPDGPRLVEVNPRQGGGYIFDLVDVVTGTHPLEMLVDLALGRMPRLGTETIRSRRATARSAAVVFVMSPRQGTVRRISGLEALEADPRVHRWTMTPAPVTAHRPRDNDAYIGHVLVADPDGDAARAHAETLVGGLRLHFDDGETAQPLGIPSGLVMTPPPATAVSHLR
ncbi:ATP-grasp domain-containing protein [Phytoactinopolyspora halotolerans]|uniref:ATP-grasp domain-containing protein n=1 Tax=Phytoactinopolyspora halotolerans TaxID=1981512 RepID=A0A6L9SCJ2_9ACTN|nr:ATP-grasp domain-containing protein [Phytoactinopolyspora halotolerans]NEE02946.1 ATP-grasp domain-containing protein [Phytoactinopolyspora halotolerans]